jgi:hypothetical protein
VTFDTPSQLTAIPYGVFTGCCRLTTLTIPDSVTDVSPYAFDTSVVTSITGSAWTTIAGLVARLDTIFCCLGTPSSIIIPGSIPELGDKALSRVPSLRDLSLEEGTVRIGASAFLDCDHLERAAFPASLVTIEAYAFQGCISLRQITFAAGSQLQYIRGKAFADCPLNEVVIPASIVEIDPCAFQYNVWQDCVKFEGPPLFLIDDHFIRSLDARVIFRSFSPQTQLLIDSSTEVIGADIFRDNRIHMVLFETGTRLREIGSGAFAACEELKRFNVPESVEILGKYCFGSCREMKRVEFEGSSRLKRIGERAFSGCKLDSITIPALAEEIDGSAFVDCPLREIRVAPGSLNFKVEGNLLVRSDGTEIVRYFGLDREIVVHRKVKVLGKSCFERCKHLDKIEFKIGSELERVGRAALHDCVSLVSIEIPVSVRVIEEGSFEGCTDLESCLIARDSPLVTIGGRAFAKCTSLRSFDIPQQVGEIGSNCFSECIYLCRLKFGSCESLKRIIGDRSPVAALDEFGVIVNSSLFRIEIEDEGVELKFPGWDNIGEWNSQLSLARDLQ